MKYLKRFNESKSEIDKLIDPVRSEIEDILIEFKSGYDLRFQYYSFFGSFQLEIIPKGYPLTHSDIEPVLIDSDILGDLMAVCKLIKSELSFNYMNSQYYESKDIRYNYPLDDVFKSSGKLVTVIQMYFKRADNLNESFDMSSRYGSDIIDQCDSLMLDIKDLSYDLQDLGFDITLYYSYSTMNLQRSTPRIELNIFGSDSLFRDNVDIFQETIDTIKKVISSHGFSYGASYGSLGLTNKKYVLIIEK